MLLSPSILPSSFSLYLWAGLFQLVIDAPMSRVFLVECTAAAATVA